jgi:alpha-1,6-mannosyltransferase
VDKAERRGAVQRLRRSEFWASNALGNAARGGVFGWLLLAALLAGLTAYAVVAGDHFGVGNALAAMPVSTFTASFLIAGIAGLALIHLVDRARNLSPPQAKLLLAAILVFGFALRIALLASQPILEVDFNRYLWDGAMTARGFNPYAIAPGDIAALPYDDQRLELSKRAIPAFERISYPELKTIYPPVAQAAFALAYAIQPFSLTAWRIVCIGADTLTLALLLALLPATGRSPLWVALYWWNPLVLKEVVNSAHMEAILAPLVLGALLLSLRQRHAAAVAVLGLAIGTKLWPVMLLPLVLRPMVGQPWRLITALMVLILTAVAFALPIYVGGLDRTSGFISFATHWTTNSALFPFLEWIAGGLLGQAGTGSPVPGLIVRAISALAVLWVAIWIARPAIQGPADLIGRAYAIVTVLLLLSPAQFPWYVLWVLPLAVLQPGFAWHVAAALMPLYYSAFHFRAVGSYPLFETYVVWVLWLPIWGALAVDWWRLRRTAASTS